ncbi:MAG: serine/threonine protein kinase [Actinobacteria bacterium]|nr:serine/threonine protein kinase [Actinomycetota bacterium]
MSLPARVRGYEIVAEVGRGGFSVVYLAHQPHLHRTVALKVLTQVDSGDTEALRRFEGECRAIGSLSWHPNVVTVYDAGTTDDGLPYLAMEHLPAGSLQAKLADHGPAPWPEVVKVGIQIADALAAAHQAGVLHRDVKPANVLTSRFGDYELADFGIARFTDVSRTASGIITGTVSYTAPEVLQGQPASQASDLYSLGALLHALVTGRAPFTTVDEESVMAVLYRATSEPPESLDGRGLPADLTGLIVELMAKEPAQRPDSAIDAGRRLQAVAADAGLAVHPLRSAPAGEEQTRRAAVPADPGPRGSTAPPAFADAAPSGRLPAEPPVPPPSPATSETGPDQAPDAPASVGPHPGVPVEAVHADLADPAQVPGVAAGARPGSTVPFTPVPPRPPAAESRHGRRRLLVALVAVVLLLGAGGLALGLVRRGGTERAAGRTTAPPTTKAPGTGVSQSSSSPETAPRATSSTTAATSAPSTTASSDPGRYNDQTRAEFMRGCDLGGAQTQFCACVYRKVVARVPYDDFRRFAGSGSVQDLPPALAQIVSECTTGG